MTPPAPDPQKTLIATMDQLQAELDNLSTQIGMLFVSIVCVLAMVAVIELRRR